MSSVPSKNYILNLVILGIAIVLVVVARRNTDLFVGRVPITPIGGEQYPFMAAQPIGQPMMYQRQLYPARVPWGNLIPSRNSWIGGGNPSGNGGNPSGIDMGRPCEGGCGDTGVCQEGVCTTVKNKTVFDLVVA